MTETHMSSYPPEVAQLTTLGEPEIAEHRAVWPDYRAMGLTADHLEDLLRLAEYDGPGDELDDDNLDDDNLDDENAWWAIFHACCALGQLQLVEAAPRVLDLSNSLIGFDFFSEEVPRIMSAMGPAVIDAVVERTVDPDWDASARNYALEALSRIGRDHPAALEKCREEFEWLLSRHRKNEPEFNGFVVSGLIDLKHTGAIGLIRTAYTAGDVEPSICGDLEDVEIALGLRLFRDTPRPHYNIFAPLEQELEDQIPSVSPAAGQAINPFKGVGRNDPCPCGSGKKFKKCCLPHL